MTLEATCTSDPCDVRSVALTYRDGHEVHAHRHSWGQLVYARSGVMRVVSGDTLWFVPPTRAIWIPAETEHQFKVTGEVAFRTLYLAPRRSQEIARGLGALEVSPLLGALILHIVSLGTLDPGVIKQRNLARVLIDLISDAPAVDLMLPLPADPRAMKLAEHFQLRTGDRTELSSLAPHFGASVRTLQRCFIAETGVTIDLWRQKARLIASTSRLSAGESVTTCAFACGYESPSAYIAAFKRQFSVTPGQFKRTPAPA